jgi:hypothetical protein
MRRAFILFGFLLITINLLSQKTYIWCGTLIDGISDDPRKNITIVIEKNGKAPFDFFLICELADKQSQWEAQLFFDAELNAMLKIMASKPLTNFLNLIAAKLKEI